MQEEGDINSSYELYHEGIIFQHITSFDKLCKWNRAISWFWLQVTSPQGRSRKDPKKIDWLIRNGLLSFKILTLSGIRVRVWVHNDALELESVSNYVVSLIHKLQPMFNNGPCSWAMEFLDLYWFLTLFEGNNKRMPFVQCFWNGGGLVIQNWWHVLPSCYFVWWNSSSVTPQALHKNTNTSKLNQLFIRLIRTCGRNKLIR